MGITVMMSGWEVESYGSIPDADELVVEFFRRYWECDDETRFLQYIGPNDTVVFNNEQTEDFVVELKEAIRKEVRPEVRAIGVKIFRLALNYMKEGRTYLEFIGDPQLSKSRWALCAGTAQKAKLAHFVILSID